MEKSPSTTGSDQELRHRVSRQQISTPQPPSAHASSQTSNAPKLRIMIGIRMAVWTFLLLVAVVNLRNLLRNHDVPDVNITQYFGPGDGDGHRDNVAVKVFKIDYGPTEIGELRAILGRHLRLQPPIDDVGFTYGFNSKMVQPLVDYWRNTYLVNWPERQEYLNQFRQFKTQINGLNVHFIHEKPKDVKKGDGVTRMGLLLLHGWPGSVREFYDIIPMLTSKSNGISFEVVAPSLVGYGFSDAAAKAGFSTAKMAIVMRNLMVRLGFTKYMVQGGDWGSIIGSQLTTLFPNEVIGYHSNFCMLRTPKSMLKYLIASAYPKFFVKQEYLNFHFPISDKIHLLIEESGYFHLQATKPDTIGVALSNNPIGLAAYILEKFSTGTNIENRLRVDGGLTNNTIGLDALLDNVMIYYLTNSITSSMRLYYETTVISLPNYDRMRTKVPTACIRFKHDLPPAFDWQLRDKYPNLKQSRYVQKGGHFAAMQVPRILYKDIVDFAKTLT